MSSLIEGYNYDIFISYRQKDNKGDRWVSEFVEALKTELESTFKEEISVYFDINPHDGLLETHDVDASLKDKLKCLVFIPIISRTYCDPKSFAWKHEFKAFIEQASQDQFGLKVKLPNGNVANRVLPVQIHELNAEDRKLVEGELGGYLRGIEFIYKESGVNRPLMANEDHPDNNLNKTFYRNQINKIANTISEIIDGLKHTDNTGKEIAAKIKKPLSGKTQNTKIITVSLLLLALIIVGYFILPRLIKPTEQLEKSIAVLPFINDSPVDSNKYFINGIMEEVLNNLQKIKDLRVLSRTSTDQYKDKARPTLPEIAKKLKVNYIVEGSGQKYGNKFVLRVQLLVAKNEGHIWGKSYDREIKQTSDIISIQSEIAQLIAAELKTTITPEEKQLIEQIPTSILTAYDFYQRGKEEYAKFWIDNSNTGSLKKAEIFFKRALKEDSTFARAYVGLGEVYGGKHLIDSTYFSKNYHDSCLILFNRALFHNNKLAEAYSDKGDYYSENGNTKQAKEEYNKALEFNPNLWDAYLGLGNLLFLNDPVLAIYNYQKASSLNRGVELPEIFRGITSLYFSFGFIDLARNYNLEALKLDGDSIKYLFYLGTFERCQGNYNKAIEIYGKGYLKDSVNSGFDNMLGWCYLFTGQFKGSLKYFKSYISRLKINGRFSLNEMHRIGYAYWQNGYKKEADSYFDKQLDYCKSSILLGREYAQNGFVYYDLAGIYAFRGEKAKAYKNLKVFYQKNEYIPLALITLIKNDPLFNNIRSEPDFQQVIGDMEVKYRAAHEKVRKWLEENSML